MVRYLTSQIHNDTENATSVQQDFELFYQTQCYPLNFWAVLLFRLGTYALVVSSGLLMFSTLQYQFLDLASGACVRSIPINHPPPVTNHHTPYSRRYTQTSKQSTTHPPTSERPLRQTHHTTYTHHTTPHT